MKDQYVGDISDFEKYAILRALASQADLPLAICWMQTSPDQTGEGGRVDYLRQPERYRHLDTPVFDSLAAIVESGERNVAAIERSGVLERARFFARPVEDHLGSRSVYFREVWSTLEERSLVFLDPDIGFAGATVKKGNKRSSMYIFDDELREGFRRGHSLVVFDHWKRVQRFPYLASAFARLSESTGVLEPFALWGSERVAFFVLPQEADAEALTLAAADIAHRWEPLLSFTRASDFGEHAEP